MKIRVKNLAKVILTLFLSFTASANDMQLSTNNQTYHDLSDIRQHAVQFLIVENNKSNIDEQWIAGSPNMKVLVPRCAVPLSVKWVSKSYGLSGDNLVVNCRISTSPTHTKKWNVFVPVQKN